MDASRAGGVVLVTGYPRLLARLVTEELLAAEARRPVKLLVPAPFVADAEGFARGLARRGLVEVVEGDVASIDFGLGGREYTALANDVRFIQHHAQLGDERTDPRAIETVNVRGTREVLEFARLAPQLERLVHGSSAAVAGDRTGTVYEQDLDAGQRLRTPAEQTLHRAERLVRAAMPSVPTTVLRPSIIVGDSRTGETDRLDGPYLLVLLIMTSPVEISVPLPARGDAPLNLVPVDYVARAAVALMTEPEARGKSFHLVDPAPLPARRVYELVAAAAGRKQPRGFIPANLTRALLRAPGLDRLAESPRAFIEQLATPVRYDAEGARRLLLPRGIDCPPFDRYVDVLVGHVRDRLAARRARRDDVAEIDDPLA